jgi:RNA polymerase sigma factor (sigma-70 family)
VADSSMSVFLQLLRGTLLSRKVADRTDGQLLEGFLSRREEAALADLVRRHGPMVWGVCRRVLPDYHDAEDAFQATFLVLVRKAASIVPREMVANWLYGVAHQTALKARATAAKRRRRERQVAEMPEPAVTEQDLWRDLQPVLDEELSRLPDKYRVVLVLCDLECKTRKEAARLLGCPEGTVAGRLARARVILAKRLARHGLTVSGGALAAVLSQKAASACVPPFVLSSTIKAASLFAAEPAAAAGVISANAAALTEKVLQTMSLPKIKSVVAVSLVLAALGIGVSGVMPRSRAQVPPPESPQATLPKQDAGNLQETVLALQKRIWEANAKQDVAAMKSLLADDFVGRDKNGNPFDKADELLYVSRWCEFDHSLKEAKVILLNDSSAVVVYEVHYKVRPTKSQEVRYVEARQGTGAWAKRNGQWWYVFKESHAVSPEKQRNFPIEVHWKEDVLKEFRQIEEKAIPFPVDKEKQAELDLGFYPPAKALLDKAKERNSQTEAYQKALGKMQAIAEIEANLKKLAESTDDKEERAALGALERAVREMRHIVLGKIFPLKDLESKDKQE